MGVEKKAVAGSAGRPPLSVSQLVNMSVGFLGIQFAWTIQMSQMSPLYQKLGASDSQFSIFWMAGPITGILVQPIIGSLSDRTWTRIGRRRPFFLIGAVLTALTLVLMPNVTSLMPTIPSALLLAAVLLWVLDASINTSMGPYRALIPDIAPPSQHATANSCIGFAIGAGAVASALIGGLDVVGKIAGGDPSKASGAAALLLAVAPTNTHLLFYIGALTVLLAVGYTVLTTREYPPDDMAAFKQKKADSAGFGMWISETWRSVVNMPKEMAKLCAVQFFTWFPLFVLFIFFSVYVAVNIYKPDRAAPDFSSAAAEALAARSKGHGWEIRRADGKPFTLAVIDARGGAVSELRDLSILDSGGAVVRKLEGQFGGVSFTASGDSALAAYEVRDMDVYEQGNRWGSLCYMVWNIVCFVASLAMGPLADRMGKKLMHTIGLATMTAAFGIFYFARTPGMAMAGMAVLGIGWATTVTMPYALLAGMVPKSSEGVLMGTFNIFICIPQLLCAGVMGWVVEVAGNRGVAFLVAAAFSLVALLLLQGVREKRAEG